MTPQAFLSYFGPKRFIKELRARTKEGALRELTERLAAEQEIRDSRLLLEMLKRRESLGSTGIGKGVAIPHGRSLATPRLKVVFARSKRGIDFDAIDGALVHLFFLIVAPYQDTKNEYLPLLGKVVEAVKQKRVRGALMGVETFEELRTVLEDSLHGR